MKNITLMILEQEEAKNKKLENSKKVAEKEKNDKDKEDIESLRKVSESKLDIQKKYTNFVNETKEILLSEAIYMIFDKAMGIQMESECNNLLKKTLVNNFIKENGVNKLLSNFRYKTYVLSEITKLVESTSKSIIEAADKDNPETFKINVDDEENFYDQLDTEDIDEISSAIRIRVSDAVDEFIQGNITAKAEIKETIQNTQDKISNTDNDTIKESLEISSKARMTNIRNNRRKNILECMIYNVSSNVLKNENLKNIYMTEGKIDMDKIVENCTTMYTFLETINTSKMIDVNESYIENILKTLK